MLGLKFTKTVNSFFIAVLMMLLCSPVANAEISIDELSSLSADQVSVQYSRGRYDRRTGQMQYVATYTNVSGETLNGPFYLEIADISSPNMTVVAPTDI